MKKNHASVVKSCEQPANEARCALATGSAGSVEDALRQAKLERRFVYDLAWPQVLADEVKRLRATLEYIAKADSLDNARYAAFRAREAISPDETDQPRRGDAPQS